MLHTFILLLFNSLFNRDNGQSMTAPELATKLATKFQEDKNTGTYGIINH